MVHQVTQDQKETEELLVEMVHMVLQEKLEPQELQVYQVLLVMLKVTELQSHLGGLQHPEIEQPLEEHPQFVKELESLEQAHALLDRVTGSRHGRSGKLLLWRGRDRKMV